MTDTCPNCGDPVLDGEMHPWCLRGVLTAILYRRHETPSNPHSSVQ